MDTDRLKAFRVVVQSGSMKKAAETMNYTQSGLLYMMNALEEELGVQLLERSYRGVFLTQDGKKLFPTIEKILIEIDHLEEMIQPNTLSDHETCIRIAAYPVIARSFLSSQIQKFREQYPNVNIQVFTTMSVGEMVADEKVDFGLGGPPTVKPGLQTYLLRQEEVLVVIPVYDKNRFGETVTLDELTDYNVLLPSHVSPDSIHYAEFEQWGSERARGTQIISSDGITLLHMVGKGLGITMLSNLYKAEAPSSVHMLSLCPPVFRDVLLIQNPRHQLVSAAKKFIELLKIEILKI
ncbi:MAG: LysR family transcriptional regulator [Clostridiales bacterium]|nr:LysR family transcriptional regulator [Clostridiales bacterium]